MLTSFDGPFEKTSPVSLSSAGRGALLEDLDRRGEVLLDEVGRAFNYIFDCPVFSGDGTHTVFLQALSLVFLQAV